MHITFKLMSFKKIYHGDWKKTLVKYTREMTETCRIGLITLRSMLQPMIKQLASCALAQPAHEVERHFYE